jgi:hypothetical protein
VPTPMAPELGLYLDEAMYTGYSAHRADTHEPVTLAPYAEQVAAFKAAHIYPHIVRTEAQEHTVANWLRELNTRNLDLRAKPVRATDHPLSRSRLCLAYFGDAARELNCVGCVRVLVFCAVTDFQRAAQQAPTWSAMRTEGGAIRNGKFRKRRPSGSLESRCGRPSGPEGHCQTRDGCTGLPLSVVPGV